MHRSWTPSPQLPINNKSAPSVIKRFTRACLLTTVCYLEVFCYNSLVIFSWSGSSRFLETFHKKTQVHPEEWNGVIKPSVDFDQSYFSYPSWFYSCVVCLRQSVVSDFSVSKYYQLSSSAGTHLGRVPPGQQHRLNRAPPGEGITCPITGSIWAPKD